MMTMTPFTIKRRMVKVLQILRKMRLLSILRMNVRRGFTEMVKTWISLDTTNASPATFTRLYRI